MNVRNFFLSWGMVFAYVILNSFGALIIKHHINKLGKVEFSSMGTVMNYFIELLKSPLIIVAILSIFISAFVWMIALSRLEISVAYPVAVGLNFVVVVTVALLLFKEQLTLAKIIGIVLIFISIFLLSR